MPLTDITLSEVVEFCIERGYADTACLYARIIYRQALGESHRVELFYRLVNRLNSLEEN